MCEKDFFPYLTRTLSPWFMILEPKTLDGNETTNLLNMMIDATNNWLNKTLDATSNLVHKTDDVTDSLVELFNKTNELTESQSILQGQSTFVMLGVVVFIILLLLASFVYCVGCIKRR